MSKEKGYECNPFSLSESGKSLGSSESGTGTFSLEKNKIALGSKGSAPIANEFSASKSGKKL